MSDPGNKQVDNDGAATRPDGLADAYWDGDKNAVRFDAVTKDLTDLPALRDFKTAADTRAAGLPKSEADYAVTLPEGFKLPDGLKFEVDANLPLVTAARSFAKEQGLDQKQFSGLVGVFAQHLLDSEKGAAEAATKIETEQTAALGEKAAERRDAAKTWLGANLSKEAAALFGELLTYKDGVEGVEKFIKLATGAQARGNSNGEPDNKNAELAESIGKPGFTAMDIFNAAKAA